MILLQFIVLSYWIINTYIYLYRSPERAPDASDTIQKPRQPEPIPEKVIIKEPEPEPVQYKPEPVQKVDRIKLEKIASNCLTASGCKFDVWHYCRNKSDVELMDIIKDFNLKYNFE